MTSKQSLNVAAIDDESHCLLNMSILLESSGYTITALQGGCAGMEYLLVHAHHIDVVLLDMMMPDKSGMEVLRY